MMLEGQDGMRGHVDPYEGIDPYGGIFPGGGKMSWPDGDGIAFA